MVKGIIVKIQLSHFHGGSLAYAKATHTLKKAGDLAGSVEHRPIADLNDRLELITEP
jgi:hypothetical protein